MKSHRHVQEDGRRRRTVPSLLLHFTSFLWVLLLQSGTVQAFQFGRILGPLSSSSSSRSAARPSDISIRLLAQEGASDMDETNIHQHIASEDAQAWPELEIHGPADSLMAPELGLLAWRNRVVWAQQVLLPEHCLHAALDLAPDSGVDQSDSRAATSVLLEGLGRKQITLQDSDTSPCRCRSLNNNENNHFGSVWHLVACPGWTHLGSQVCRFAGLSGARKFRFHRKLHPGM
jgi:hypothetical protein